MPNPKPLTGFTVAVTREARRAVSMAAALHELGATVVHCPTIEIVDPVDPSAVERAFQRETGYDWIVFTSANGVERTVDRLLAAGRNVQSFGSARVAAIGPASADALRSYGVHVDVVPEAYVAESLFAALGTGGTLAGSRILLARAAVARDVLPDALRAAGAHVDIVDVYRTIIPNGAAESVRMLLADTSSLLVAFTSASTAANFAALAGSSGVAGVRAACIGPITAAAARDLGFSVVVEASTFSTSGLVEALARWAVEHADGQSGQTA